MLTIFFVFVLFFNKIFTWDLSILKVSPTYYASSIAIYRNRAFLALPRSSCFNNISNPTLIEVPWPNDNKYGVFRKKLYPSYKQQKYGDCKDQQDVISLDVDSKKAKLWVLDKGNKKCSPKIVIYNLYYNTIGQSSRLTDYKGENLNYILVDLHSDGYGGRAFIGGLENIILVFSTKTLKVKKVNLLSPINFVPTRYLAISLIKPVIYLTSDKDIELYSIDLENLLNCERIFSETDTCEINAEEVGEKLGPSTGMVADSKGRLYYYLRKDYAIVKWTESLPIIAENHEVVKQSYKDLPYVSHFVLEAAKVFALVNNAKSDICYKTNNVYKDLPKLKSRIVVVQ